MRNVIVFVREFVIQYSCKKYALTYNCVDNKSLVSLTKGGTPKFSDISFVVCFTSILFQGEEDNA